MIQSKFSIGKNQAAFLENHGMYGFRNRSEMVRAAIDNLKRDMEKKRLSESADLYAKIYSTDEDLKKMTEAAMGGWPE